MDKVKRWLDDKLFQAKTGITTRTINDGNPVDEVVIRYKDYYFGVMLDTESGEPTGDFSWSEDPTMFHAPLREHYIVIRPPQRDE